MSVLVKAGVICGIAVGLTLGMMVSTPAGIVFCVSLGATIGIVAGVVMDREEKRSNLRTKQLDDIIGVTRGSLGAPPSAPPHFEKEEELKSWVSEWLTPPAPHVG
jgi:hypothetical protein